MKRTVALLSFWVALVLFGTAPSAYLEEIRDTPYRRRDSFTDISKQDDAAVLQESQRHPDAPHFLAKLALTGVAFLIAGGALWGKPARSQKPLAR